MARTRKQPLKRTKNIPKLKKPTFFGKFFSILKNLLSKIFKPFRFILKPFKTKPFKLLGKLLSKILLINYFKTSWHELKQVTWPGRKETTQLTIAVFIFAIGFGLLIAIVDFGLSKLFQGVILK